MKNKVGIRILVPRHIVQGIWRNKSCLNKNQHFCTDLAEEQIHKLERRGLASVGSVGMYACQFCGAYHVGHQMKTA